MLIQSAAWALLTQNCQILLGGDLLDHTEGGAGCLTEVMSKETAHQHGGRSNVGCSVRLSDSGKHIMY